MMLRKKSLQIQTVLYNNEQERIIRSIKSIVRAVDFAIHDQVFEEISIYYGDGSQQPVFTEQEIENLNAEYGEYIKIKYDCFESNLGSARGHNRLANHSQSDFIMIINPDILLAPDTILQLALPYDNVKQKVGIVEAKQLPVEHPKLYNPKTGETSWASTACVLIPRTVFEEVNGFDADTFFLYCDDVDFSWMVRLKGYRVIFQPSAVAFHDKTLSESAAWQTSDAEDYYSAEAGLLMAYKWSRPDILKNILTYFENSGINYYVKAAKEFKSRERENKLPVQVDSNHKIGEFIDNNYGKMRFLL
ncbi:glycosyltransferase family 2 protein [Paenibacillus sp. NPDC056722]|uniref:glycosyltransferase family 2 protein n=1 Tax=Paenibacillus sp. NPDC056722 TaxID=3345924 RepID=UPI00367CCDCF